MQPAVTGAAIAKRTLYALDQRRIPLPHLDGRNALIARTLDHYEPTDLADIDSVALMNRVEAKYLLSRSQLSLLLAALFDDYRALEVAGARLSHYRTLYFDTSALDLYMSHHRGRPERVKVRSRTYLDTDTSFLEVKRRTNKGRTIKDRVETQRFISSLEPETGRFVKSLAPNLTRPLQPTLWNEFLRITLVNKHSPERVTLDLDLRCWADGRRTSLGDLVVVEVKRPDRGGRNSPMLDYLHMLRVRPTAFSKYCVGLSRLYPSLKQNRFKPILARANQLARGDYDV